MSTCLTRELAQPYEQDCGNCDSMTLGRCWRMSRGRSARVTEHCEHCAELADIYRQAEKEQQVRAEAAERERDEARINHPTNCHFAAKLVNAEKRAEALITAGWMLGDALDAIFQIATKPGLYKTSEDGAKIADIASQALAALTSECPHKSQAEALAAALQEIL